MKILLLEPYYTGSHAAWAAGYARHSRHEVAVSSLPGAFWKWRMHGGAVALAERFLAAESDPELILATDMLDLTTFLALTRRRTAAIPTALYFHENQLTYPWSPTDRDVVHHRDKHYGFINYASALAADTVLFNSRYHQESFLGALPNFLKHFPDYNELDTVDRIRARSQVLPLGLDLRRFDAATVPQPNQKPLLVWAHRWEYDKGPAEFFEALTVLSDRGLEFDLAVLGENFSRRPDVFLEAKKRLAGHIVRFGYVKEFAAYARWLWRADIMPVTSHQDFFGASLVQALYCGCFPLLPRRLAYPELIPPEYHARCFYEDFDDLTTRLHEAVTNIDRTRHFSLRPVAARYDWQTQSKLYDELFFSLTHPPQTG